MKVFSHRGIIGIESSPYDKAILAHPGGGNIGVVADASLVEISEDALQLLKTIKVGRDSIGDVDCFRSGDKIIFGWLGGYCMPINPKGAEAARGFKPELLKVSPNVFPSSEFVQFVDDSYLKGIL